MGILGYKPNAIQKAVVFAILEHITPALKFPLFKLNPAKPPVTDELAIPQSTADLKFIA